MELTETQKDALNHEKSISVTAGAGTGKTKILVEKYIGLFETFPNLQIPEILALTFTKKAAAEMKNRIRNSLSTMEGSRWQELQENFVWSRISTFHSFALDILRRAPLLVRLPPKFQVVEPTILEPTFDEIFESMINAPLESLGDWGTSLVSLLKEYGVRETKKTLCEFYKKRYLVEIFFKRFRDSPETIEEEWHHLAQQFAQEFINILPSAVRGQIDLLWNLSEKHSMIDEKDTGSRYLDENKPFLRIFRDSFDAIKQIKTSNEINNIRPRGNIGSKKYFDQDDLDTLRDSKKELLTFLKANERSLNCIPDDEKFRDEVWRMLLDYMKVYTVFSQEINQKKKQLGFVDFDDLLNLLTNLIETDPDYFDSLIAKEIKFILVDEFQDTDSRQFRIIKQILGELREENNSLFIVGDPKQSIYLFRDADVTLFKKTEEIIKSSLIGDAKYLERNFRSTPEIVTFTNSIFTSLFSSTTKP